MLETSEDIAPQSREILQTLIGWGTRTCPPSIQTSIRFFNFTDFKAHFPIPAVSMDSRPGEKLGKKTNKKSWKVCTHALYRAKLVIIYW